MMEPDSSVLDSLLSLHSVRTKNPVVTSFFWFLSSNISDDIQELDSLNIGNSMFPWFIEQFVRYNRGILIVVHKCYNLSEMFTSKLNPIVMSCINFVYLRTKFIRELNVHPTPVLMDDDDLGGKLDGSHFNRGFEQPMFFLYSGDRAVFSIYGFTSYLSLFIFRHYAYKELLSEKDSCQDDNERKRKLLIDAIFFVIF